jgi:hypothetical protein
MPPGQAPFDLSDPGQRADQLVDNRLQDRARELREPLLLMRNGLGQDLDMPQTLRRNDAEFGHVSPQCIDEHRALPDQKTARPM